MSIKNSNIDDLFRDKFKDFEPNPPEHIWENIRQRINTGGDSNPGKPFTKGGIAGISTIIILIGLLSFYQIQNDDKKSLRGFTESNSLALNDYPIQQTDAKSELEFAMKSESDPGSKPSGKKVKRMDEPAIIIGKEVNIPDAKIGLTDDKTDKNLEGKVNDQSGLRVEEASMNFIENRHSNPIALLDSKPEDYFVFAKSGALNPGKIEVRTEEKITALSVSKSDAKHHGDYGKPDSWLLGLYFTPEMLYNPSDNRLNTRNYSLDINATYRFSGYMVQSGLGAMWSSDAGNCKIDYNQYLGSYEDVYNVTFDTTGGEVIPTYYTETVMVYDTINHISVTPAENKYTYLNVPLLFGYGNEGRKFGWFIKAGPSLSVLVSEKLNGNNLSDSPNRIINIENEVPTRIQTNWHLLMSGGVTLGLGKNLNISIEPVFRYYIKSAYELNKVKSKNPYSVGLRAGLQVSF